MSPDPANVPVPIAPRRVLLVGWDAADARMLDGLVSAGALPEFGRLVAAGAIGDLAAIGPPVGSLAWTSIATGVRPDRHGILDDFEFEPGDGTWQPISARRRAVKAIWNIATQTGLRSVIVGWGAGHPAEPVLGASVDERFVVITGPVEREWPIAEGSVHPPELGPRLADLRLHPSEFESGELVALVPSLGEIDLAKDLRPMRLAECLAATVSLHAVATELLEHEAWQFAAIRYPLLGHLASTFLRCRPPRGEGVPDEDVRRYGGVIDGAHRLLDAMLARLREIAGPETTVIVASECGLRAGAVHGDWRRPAGLVAIAGPGTRPDGLIHGANHLDVAPTVLALLGLPAGSDMPGRILDEAFTVPPAGRRIPSWESLAGECGRLAPAEAAGSVRPWQHHEAVQQLVALGYVAEDRAHDARHAAIAARADYHRAMVHLDAFEWAAAVEPLRRVVAARPGDLQVALLLAFALSLVGGLDECRSLADAVSANPALAPYAEAIRGLIASAEGRDADAVAAFVACERGAPPTGFLLDRLGWAYLRLGRLEEAERVLRRSRELEPEGRFAPFALAGILLDRDRPAEAAEEALQAIGRHYRWPEAHARLGVALARLGRTREAVRAFEISIAQRPSALAHEALATIHEQAAGDPRQVAFHRERARELRKGAGP